jgi:hypothetical protein
VSVDDVIEGVIAEAAGDADWLSLDGLLDEDEAVGAFSDGEGLVVVSSSSFPFRCLDRKRNKEVNDCSHDSFRVVFADSLIVVSEGWDDVVFWLFLESTVELYVGGSESSGSESKRLSSEGRE